jgi:hypothetical protein
LVSRRATPTAKGNGTMKLFSNKPSSKNSFLLDSLLKHFFCYYLVQKERYFVKPVILILITFFYGCLILPIPMRDDDPFPDEKKSFIIPGSTRKITVTEKLGNPSARRLGERIYIYAHAQGDLGLGIISLPFPFKDGGFAGAGHITYIKNFLIIEFDKNDIVTTVKHLSGDSGKQESGLYVMRNGVDRSKGEWFFSDVHFILGGSQIMDEQAKQYLVSSNKSAIYYYKSHSRFYEAKLDGRLSVDPGGDGFLLWVVDPGDHTISTVIEVPNSEILTIQCYPGEIYYVKHSEGIIKEEQRSIALKEISRRRLVIDRLETFDFYSSEYLQ